MSLIEALDPNNGAAVDRLATALADRIVNALRVEAAASDDLIFDTKQAAKMTGLSPRTLETLRVNGEGPVCIRLSGVSVGYRLGALRAWIRSRPRHSYRAVASALSADPIE
jgi:predicted DNA-binding transcriptional regulator AlpA